MGREKPAVNTTTSRRLVGLFMVTYLVSYVTRIDFGAIVLEMVQDTGFTKAQLSMALTGSFFTYGIGQLISGFCGDRVQPKRLILIGLLSSSAMNLLIPLCTAVEWMVVVWCINGFAQAFMWPPLVRLMVNLLTEQEYTRATVVVSWGSSLGTILVYLLSPLLILLAGWRSVFVGAALCGLVMALFWWRLCPEIAAATPVSPTVRQKSAPLFSPLLIGIMLAIVLQGSLRDGVTTWMPTYISETYRLGSSISILTGVLLPLFSIVCFRISSQLYRRIGNNPVLCGGFLFGAGALTALILMLFTGHSAVGSVLCAALLTGCMHGVNLMLICMVPAFYRERGRVSTLSGLLNSCTYVGSALSTYGIARVSEAVGWTATVGLWCGIAMVGTVVCLLCLPSWKRQFLKKHE